jgi:DNA-binding transcriptional LysR family regulator
MRSFLEVMMDIRRLKYFIALAEHLHFGRAASELGIVQPALSKQIQILEEELGVRLLDKQTRPIRLTEAGRVLLVAGREILLNLKRVKQMVRQASVEVRDKVRLGYSKSVVFQDAYKSIVEEFARTNKAVNVEFEFFHPWEIEEALLDGRCDGAFGIVIGQTSNESIASIEVDRIPFSLVLHENHPLTAVEEISLSAVLEHRFILYGRDAAYAREVFNVILGGVPAEARTSLDPFSVLSTVEAQQGISLLPTKFALNAGHHVVPRPIGFSRNTLPMTFSYHARNANPHLEEMVGIVKAFRD